MAGDSEVKRRIKSVENTRQITRTMELVATSKLKRATDRVRAARPYADALEEIVGGLYSPGLSEKYPILRRPDEIKRAAVLLLTANRGLCGGFNSNLIKAADFVRTFRNIGCKFSIDDFGTGLASHNYLRELPVDYVKIDGTFITNIHESRNDFAMAKSINDLAHFLGQETIAESVENDAIIKSLQEIGVDYLQGWGVGKPRLLATITEDLSSIDK